MEVITLDTRVYKQLAGKLDTIYQAVISYQQKSSTVEPTPEPSTENKPNGDSLILLRNSDLVKMFRVSTRTLQRFRTSGKLPYSIIGGCVYYRKEDVEAFINSGKVTTQEEKRKALFPNYTTI